jgi:hypothetical protein
MCSAPLYPSPGERVSEPVPIPLSGYATHGTVRPMAQRTGRGMPNKKPAWGFGVVTFHDELWQAMPPVGVTIIARWP